MPFRWDKEKCVSRWWLLMIVKTLKTNLEPHSTYGCSVDDSLFLEVHFRFPLCSLGCNMLYILLSPHSSQSMVNWWLNLVVYFAGRMLFKKYLYWEVGKPQIPTNKAWDSCSLYNVYMSNYSITNAHLYMHIYIYLFKLFKYLIYIHIRVYLYLQMYLWASTCLFLLFLFSAWSSVSNPFRLRACWDRKWEAGTIGRRSPRQMPSWSEIIFPAFDAEHSAYCTGRQRNLTRHCPCRCSEQHCVSSGTIVFCHQSPTFKRILEQLTETTKEYNSWKVWILYVNLLVRPMQFINMFFRCRMVWKESSFRTFPWDKLGTRSTWNTARRQLDVNSW